MSICVWYADRRGRPDRDVPARYFESAAAVLEEVAEYRAGPMSKTHLLRINGDIPLKDMHQLIDSGLLIAAAAYLPPVGRAA